MKPPQPTFIYHITHGRNLAAIIDCGSLYSNAALMTMNKDHQSVAYPDLQHRRAGKAVPCEPRGTLHNYVPFYFAPRSPMLFTINKGNVPGHTEGQAPIIYLVSTVQVCEASGIPLVFTDGHAIVSFTKWYTHLADLDKIDWDIMRATYWQDTSEDGDRSRRRQAEFLLHHSVPWEMITEIGVKTKLAKGRVEEIISRAAHRPPIVVQTRWYY